ncbi:winged helix-turn-helix transcriptional regulator [Limisphaera sp. VF-2]|jgi:DNA-binding HxlR family transcriptional regulator|uniref:winged helix-turn-helix transcriptional regulator n=1 Tax=Limisphaera sp. VF-2 TaxID=3400418 RepID=UPI00256CB503|nr:helix-turn-helix transcriptional regulator [Limisphaera sp.]
MMKPGYLSLKERTAYRRLEDVVGCKWSAAVLAAIARGVTRPGQLERFIPGISTKVLNERLRKLLDYGLITRTEKPGRVLEVHYQLTPTGQKLSAILDQLRELDEEHARQVEAAREGAATDAPTLPGPGASPTLARPRKRPRS